MYIVIRSHADLADRENRRALMNSDHMLTRFVMNGCPWCEKTQPEWDKMAREMTPRLGERHAIAEVESDFAEHFRELMAKHHKPLPPVRRFPSVYIMSRGKYTPSPGNDSTSLIRILQQMKMLREQSHSPRVSFMEKELTPIKHVILKPTPLRKRRKLSHTRSRTRSQSRSRTRSQSRTPLSFTIRQRTPTKI